MAKSGNSGGIDLSKLSIEELEILARDVQAEIVARKEAERERVLQQMRELAGSLGMTLEEVLRMEKRGGGGSGGVQAKYRHPDNPDLTWSGRGKRPAWVAEALASGKSLEDLTVS
ncbi:MAG TPA: H-NS histone family protein [Thermoanaerobaculia bacterium]|nr:H-NS histone family protein [Thermoanaerobaculia bacterium]